MREVNGLFCGAATAALLALDDWEGAFSRACSGSRGPSFR